MESDGWDGQEDSVARAVALVEKLKHLKNLKSSEPIEEKVFEKWCEYDSDDEDERPLKQRIFTPPLQYQRNQFVRNDVVNHAKQGKHYRKMAVLGCGELSLERSLLTAFTSIGIEHIVSIDIDGPTIATGMRLMEECLEKHKNVVGNMKGMPAILNLYKGDILEHDPCLGNVDVVCCIEVIEHMPQEKATILLKHILEDIRPKIAYISTPNHEYNEVFHMEKGRFRHDDHDFEFTRKEFLDWLNRNVNYDNYDVEIVYIGNLQDFEHLGGATQFAVIEKLDGYDDGTAPVDKKYKKTGDILLPYSGRWLISEIMRESFEKFLESGGLDKCERKETVFQSVSSIFFRIVPLSDILKNTTEENRDLVHEDTEYACKSLCTLCRHHVFEEFVDGHGSLIVSEKIPRAELLGYLKNINAKIPE